MKLGVMMALFAQQSLDETMQYLVRSGVAAMELTTGNYPGCPHFDLDALLASADKCKALKDSVHENSLEISALSCHGNPLHTKEKIAREHHEVHRKTVRLAEKLGVSVVINFSGCPGDSDRATAPNWVTCPWPDDYSNIVAWQWEKKVIPYWKKEAAFAKDHGIRLAFEMHPGFCVYNTETMLRLRKACGNNIGANFDPSHLFWQGMDPIVSLRELKNAVFHVHAKDSLVDPINASKNGVLDTKSYSDEINRSWIFRTIGYGHGVEWWRNFVSTLRLIGYDGVLSIEHEDSLMSVNEGFQKAVAVLKEALLTEKAGAMWWA